MRFPMFLIVVISTIIYFPLAYLSVGLCMMHNTSTGNQSINNAWFLLGREASYLYSFDIDGRSRDIVYRHYYCLLNLPYRLLNQAYSGDSPHDPGRLHNSAEFDWDAVSLRCC